MKKITSFLLIFLSILALGCSAKKNTTDAKKDLDKELIEKNKGNVSLLNRIRRKPGIVIKGGVPVLSRTSNSFSVGSQEPLYVLNSFIVGSSFRSVNQLVDSFNVKDIRILAGSEASEYGSRGSNGVIIITTYE